MNCSRIIIPPICCTTHKAACGIETRKSVLHRLRTRRCCTTHKAACGIETSISRCLQPARPAAPHTKPRAALKRLRPDQPSKGLCCTTHKAACGIETPCFIFVQPQFRDAAPHTKPRAALKLLQAVSSLLHESCCTTHKAACGIETFPVIFASGNSVLHHTQSRVRH